MSPGGDGTPAMGKRHKKCCSQSRVRLLKGQLWLIIWQEIADFCGCSGRCSRTHALCPRCGKRSYHTQNKRCVSWQQVQTALTSVTSSPLQEQWERRRLPVVTLQRRSVPTSGPRRLDCCDLVWLLGSKLGNTHVSRGQAQTCSWNWPHEAMALKTPGIQELRCWVDSHFHQQISGSQSNSESYWVIYHTKSVTFCTHAEVREAHRPPLQEWLPRGADFGCCDVRGIVVSERAELHLLARSVPISIIGQPGQRLKWGTVLILLIPHETRNLGPSGDK